MYQISEIDYDVSVLVLLSAPKINEDHMPLYVHKNASLSASPTISDKSRCWQKKLSP